ncbi:hypothetical protein TSMEX_006880 [Taenia solium]|eukprot:TsM_000484000 transcript=TsM_000484000 gene=TsM_000484000
MDPGNAHPTSTGTDVTVQLQIVFTDKKYTTLSAFAIDTNSFVASAPELRTIVYRAMKPSCKHKGCSAHLSVGTRRGFIRVGKYFMVHRHGPENCASRLIISTRVRYVGDDDDDLNHVQPLRCTVISLKCVYGDSYTSVAIRPRSVKTKCIGCVANIKVKARDGCLVVVWTRLRHKHAVIPRCNDLSPNEGFKFKFERASGAEMIIGYKWAISPMVDRLVAVDLLLQWIRDRMVYGSNGSEWFSAFLNLMANVERAMDDPNFSTAHKCSDFLMELQYATLSIDDDECELARISRLF